MNAAPRALLRVGLGTTLVVLSFATVGPVLAVALQRRGVSASAIGVFAMLQFATIAVMIPVMPRLFARIGVMRAYRSGLVLGTIALVGYAVTESYAAWCACSVLGALGAAAEWSGTEALIAYNAPAHQRGRFTGLYQSALGGALAIGPFVPGIVGWFAPALLDRGPQPLLWGAAVVYALALVVTAGPKVGALTAARADAAHESMWQAVRAVPALVWVAFAGGVFEAGMGGISAAYGSQLGMSVAMATSIAGALGVGSFALQYPAGWLADHAPLPRVVALAGGLLLGSMLAFGLAARWPALFWLAAFLWGAVGGALYTLTMIRVAQRFGGRSTIAPTAAMITAYTVGGALGPLVSGVVLDAAGAAGQTLWLGLLAASVLLAAGAVEKAPPAARRGAE